MHSTTQHSTQFPFRDRRVVVMGLGRFGGGAGVTRWLLNQGAHVTVTDLCSENDLKDCLRDLRADIDAGCLELKLGGHDERDFATADLVVANPAVPQPWKNTYLNAARNAGVPVTTEIRLLVERLNRKRVIAVTGSAGKSTTTAMIHHLLLKMGQTAHLGGNIGGSLLNSLDIISNDDWIVLELSSAMLHWLGDQRAGPFPARSTTRLQSARERTGSPPGWSPHVAVITNISPNHIDWHGSFEHYEQSKLNISRWQSEDDVLIRGDDLPVSLRDLRVNLAIPGKHNTQNARTAIAAVQSVCEINSNDASQLLSDFPGLPHRLQFVCEFEGVRYYNDSKSTTPEATIRAVESFDDASKIHLIVGGYDKKSDLSPIAQLAKRLGGLYTIGMTGESIRSQSNAPSKTISCGTLDKAVESARNRLNPGDILLLSPGCASWDQFTNYEHRGSRFCELVQQTTKKSITHPV